MLPNKLVGFVFALAFSGVADAQSFIGTWKTDAIRVASVGAPANVSLSVTSESGGLRVIETIRFQEATETIVEDKVSITNRPIKRHVPVAYTQTREYSITFGSSRKADGGRCEVLGEQLNPSEVRLSWSCKQGENDTWTVEERWIQDTAQPNRLVVRKSVARNDESSDIRPVAKETKAEVEITLVR